MAHSAKAKALLGLITETLKLAPKLQLQGDRLTRDLDLTSSRWSFLGSVLMADRPVTVADLARRMSLKPQTVQRFADANAEKGFIAYEDNPDHKRARLIRLTPKGREALDTLMDREAEWAEGVVSGLTAKDIYQATEILARFRANVSEEH